ncbi:NAD(P)H-dependent oxidoreductase [Ideonella sp. A 288]|uniref:NAD(P)H-dependent oxidoreductase n=1 Tax=Ideonella sp. A 288 TaxID=1962181 RepID=UPI000B4B6A19|nr:NAD(P)H-dependent oxidoreductase [Ideonella sp. A 288]
MRVLTIYAHHNPQSFCHAVLERFTEGLRDAGHENEVVDLHAIHFDPVLHDRDGPGWVDDSVPDDVLAHWRFGTSLLARERNPLRKVLVKRWIGKSDDRELVRRVHALGPPRDVAEQQAKVARADALAFIAPVYFVGFPAILKGWVERVFSLGFAFGMTADAWRGDLVARVPLLRHQKALIMQTTIWDEASYDAGLKAAMKLLVDEYALRFPGIQRVEHEYFHAVHGADDARRAAYLDRAYQLGREF